jgi:hypothetical protein
MRTKVLLGPYSRIGLSVVRGVARSWLLTGIFWLFVSNQQAYGEEDPLLYEGQVVEQQGCIIVIKSSYIAVGETWELNQKNPATGMNDILARVVIGGKDELGFGYARLKVDSVGCRNYVGKSVARITTVAVLSSKQVASNPAILVVPPKKSSWPEAGVKWDNAVGVGWHEVKNIHYNPRHFYASSALHLDSSLELFPFSFGSVGWFAHNVGLQVAGKYAVSLSESGIENDKKERVGDNSFKYWETQVLFRMRLPNPTETNVWRLSLSPYHRRYLKNKGTQPSVRTPYLDYMVRGGWAELGYTWRSQEAKMEWEFRFATLLGGRGEMKYYPSFEEDFPATDPQFTTGRWKNPKIYKVSLCYNKELTTRWDFKSGVTWDRAASALNGKNISMPSRNAVHSYFTLDLGVRLKR